MRLVFTTALLLATALAGPLDEWNQFKRQYGKNYANHDEEKHRMEVFFKNNEFIQEHNSRFTSGQVTYKLKMNHLGDLDLDDVRALYDGDNRPGGISSSGVYGEGQWGAAPDSLDWRQKGAVTPVQDQEQCGANFAYSAVGSLEGQIFLQTSKLTPLSVPHLMNCSMFHTPFPCYIWTMDETFVSMMESPSSSDSYDNGLTRNCSFILQGSGVVVKGYVDLRSGDENSLKSAAANVGPISTTIDMGHKSFQFYSEGVYVEPACRSVNPNFGVLIVGYGSDGGQDFWLVRNSWGSGWGEGGYIRMARNLHNQCGIANMASYPTVVKM